MARAHTWHFTPELESFGGRLSAGYCLAGDLMINRLIVLSVGFAGVAAIQTAQPRPQYASRIMIYDVERQSATLVHQADTVWEAPNWSRDGQFLLANSDGKLYRIPVAGAGAPQALALDPSLRCNNDHDFSPDGKLIAISASSPTSRQSQVYVANADGSNARLIVSAAPAYFHGWSPDGKYSSFVANRDKKQYDLLPGAGRWRRGRASDIRPRQR